MKVPSISLVVIWVTALISNAIAKEERGKKIIWWYFDNYTKNRFSILIILLIDQLVPRFYKVNCQEKYRHFDMCLKVLFPDHTVDVLLLNEKFGPQRIFKGHFEKEKDVTATIIVNNDVNNYTVIH